MRGGAELSRHAASADNGRPAFGLPVWIFGGCAVAAAATVLAFGSDLTFYLDDWDLLLRRRGGGADVYLDPHNVNIAVLLVAVFKLLQGGFGMEIRAFQAASAAAALLAAAAVFAFARRAAGAWVALALTLPLLALGTSAITFLMPFQLAFFASVAAGVAGLLALGRDDRLAAALTTVGVLFSSVGLTFVIASAVHVAWGCDRVRRAWVVALPALVYLAWYFGWGREAEPALTLANVAHLPAYVLDGLASSLSSLLGLAAPRDEAPVTPLDWGRPLLVLAAALVALRLWRLGRISREVAVSVAAAVGFWSLAGLNAGMFRTPTQDRYQYVGAVLLVLVAAELLRGARIRRPAMAALLAGSTIALAANLSALRDGQRLLEAASARVKAGLAAVEIARDTVAPDFVAQASHEGVLFDESAGDYLAAVDAHGSPAFTEDELLAAPDDARGAADAVLAAALRIELGNSPAADEHRAGPCLAAREKAPATLGPGVYSVRARGGDVRLGLRRFATGGFPVELGVVSQGAPARLALPRDRSAEEWELAPLTEAELTVCPVGTPGAPIG